MKHDFFTVTKKEFKRFFGDRRLFFSTIILPGLMIFIIYSIMGNLMQDAFSPDKEYKPKVYTVNAPKTVENLLGSLKVEQKVITEDKVDSVKKKIGNQDADMLLVFPENFEDEVMAYDVIKSGKMAPQVGIYFNSASTESSALYSQVNDGMNAYESSFANKFDVNAGKEKYDLATKEDTSAKMFSLMVPMLLTMMLISGCMSVAPDAIAGEKERGTMATLLVTPARRSEIAIGKIISLSVISILSGLSSFLGVMLSLPKLMGGASSEMSASVYSIQDYSMLLVVVLVTVLSAISVFAILSTIAKSTKEAATYSSPLMIVGMIVSVVGSMGDPNTNPLMYCIPVYNSVQCISGIFGMTYEPIYIIVTVISNLVFAGICVFILTKLFDSEKVMFSK